MRWWAVTPPIRCPSSEHDSPSPTVSFHRSSTVYGYPESSSVRKEKFSEAGLSSWLVVREFCCSMRPLTFLRSVTGSHPPALLPSQSLARLPPSTIAFYLRVNVGTMGYWPDQGGTCEGAYDERAAPRCGALLLKVAFARIPQ